MWSMTGYGAGRAPLGSGGLTLEARAVNHRFLEVRVRLPPELAEHSHVVEAVARERLVRGRVDITGRLEGQASETGRLDQARARAALSDLRALRDALAPDEPVPLSLLAAVPELFGGRIALEVEAIRAALTQAARQGCEELMRMRRTEGEALRAELRRLREAAHTQTAAIAERAPVLVEGYRSKLRERLDQLLAGSGVPLDPGRLEHEVAVFADRADVTEEIARLHSHLGQLDQLVAQEGASVGRKLDFLLQEMAREANTVGAKVADADVTLHVVELKAVLERLREQAQNVL